MNDSKWPFCDAFLDDQKEPKAEVGPLGKQTLKRYVERRAATTCAGTDEAPAHAGATPLPARPLQLKLDRIVSKRTVRVSLKTLKGLEPFQNFAKLRRARRRRTGF